MMSEKTSDVLRELLLHDDPDCRQQGLELSRAAGPAATDAALAGLVIDEQGWLWPPPRGWSLELLQLTLDRAPHVPWGRPFQGIGLHHPGLIETISSLPPTLEALDLSWTEITDLSPLTRFSQLRWLALRGCRRVFDLSPLSRLVHLDQLDLGQTPVRDLRPLQRLPTLRTLNLEGCFLAEGLRYLPTSVRTLWMSEAGLEQPLQLDDRPIERMSIGRIEWLSTRSRYPQLSSLALDRGPASAVQGWPVTRLWLRTPPGVVLGMLDKLQWLRLSPQVAAANITRWPPQVEVLDTVDRDWLSIGRWPGAVLAAPAMVRHLGLAAPPLRRSASRWRASGHNQMLRARRDPRNMRGRIIRTLNSDYRWKMQDVSMLLNQLADERLVCLTPREATRLQGLLAAVGVPTVRLDWTPHDP